MKPQQYRIRLCPALALKPRVPTPNLAPSPSSSTLPPSVTQKKLEETIKKKDPFVPPYDSLYVGNVRYELEDSDGEGEGLVEDYVVLVGVPLICYERDGVLTELQLNKFAVIKGHFLLVTKGTSLPSPLPYPPSLPSLSPSLY